MKALVKKLLDQELSRRDFSKAMLALGYSATAAESVMAAVTDTPSPATFEFTGSGGEVLAECLKAAGVEYVFDVNSTGQASFYDALAARPELKLILALQEGQAISMAHGYELASGRTAALFVPSIGIPNTLSNLYNAWKDRSALVVFTDGTATDITGRDGFQQVDDWLQPTEQFTKWRWELQQPERIGEMTRRAIKLAGTPPAGPVYLRLPKDVLSSEAVTQTIYPQDKFTVPVHMAPRAEDIEAAARLLLAAERPMINAGSEITRAGANADLIELAELLSIPVAQGYSVYGDFPFGHPLFAGFSSMGFPNGVRRADVFLNLGAPMPDESIITAPVGTSARVINARLEYERIADRYPVEIPLAAGMSETIRALIDAVNSLGPQAEISRIRTTRLEQARQQFEATRVRQRSRAEKVWNSSPVASERLCFEMDQVLEPNAIIVPETGDRSPQEWLDFAPGRKRLIGPTTGYALGWGIGAALGVKIAQPDHQVVALIGDGAMLFGQIEALWSAARYEIPIIIVIFNNRSYDGERGRIQLGSALARKDRSSWKDMSCYLGNPDVDYVSIAKGFGIEGQKISAPGDIRAVLKRAAAVTREGHPFVIDALIARRGPGAESTWHPEISIASQRAKRV